MLGSHSATGRPRGGNGTRGAARASRQTALAAATVTIAITVSLISWPMHELSLHLAAVTLLALALAMIIRAQATIGRQAETTRRQAEQNSASIASLREGLAFATRYAFSGQGTGGATHVVESGGQEWVTVNDHELAEALERLKGGGYDATAPSNPNGRPA